jgi:hypothetical protein
VLKKYVGNPTKGGFMKKYLDVLKTVDLFKDGYVTTNS